MELVLDAKTHSHTLAADCFSMFKESAVGASIRATRTSETTFTIGVESGTFERLGSKQILYHCHWSASCLLMALNMATLGYFWWDQAPSMHPIYRVRNSPSGEAESEFTLLQQTTISFPNIRELTALDVHNAFIIYCALSQDTDSHPRTEYLKGLLHIGASYVDISFYREAFGNFYRCLEAFVTKHVLDVKQLSNEVKDIQRGLQLVGADATLQAAFKEIYLIRSNQVAHAQKPQTEVTFEEVLAAKGLADLVMCKTYRRRAEEWRARNEV